MKIFLDSANIDEIKTLSETGLIDGVTTNPSLIAKSGMNFIDAIEKICSIINGPVSAEVTGVDQTTMVKEGQKLSKIAPNVVIKVPLTMEGLKACKTLSDEKISVNVTLCFNAAQAILAAKAGATYISPFIGRLDDIGADGMNLISEIVEIYNIYNFKTEVLAASIRGVQDVVDSAKFGADIATIPTNILRSMYLHPLTDKGLDAFLSDWAKTGQSIL
ncbi:MAG: fructose-6-phosphate aldolase [SAR116 cluster bacterium]|nr:fructose-6-phosphate aldolase [SAR116 cluster bacterium]|tara:strand:+ start:7223 stop:7876 length:654 start_codon:yes stop_codon:yes gene_type:complete